MVFIPKCRWSSARQCVGILLVSLQEVEQCGHESGKDDSLLSRAEECHESNCLIAHSHSMVKMAEDVSDTRMIPRKQSEMGRYKSKQWKSGENSMGSHVRKGRSTITMWKKSTKRH